MRKKRLEELLERSEQRWRIFKGFIGLLIWISVTIGLPRFCISGAGMPTTPNEVLFLTTMTAIVSILLALMLILFLEEED